MWLKSVERRRSFQHSPSILSDFSRSDVSPAVEVECADLSLRNRSDRLLDMAALLKGLKVGQITGPVDGTQVLANASKHSAVSYPL